MIEWLEFRNFKALADVRVELSRFTVLVGPNACGKTTVLQGANMVGSMLASPDPGVAHELLRGRGDADWRTDSSVPDLVVGVGLENRQATLVLGRRTMVFEEEADRARATVEYRLDRPEPDQKGQFAERWLATTFLRVYPEIAAQAAYSDEVEPELGFGGQKLPLVLANFAADQPQVLARIRDDLRAVVPQVHDLKMPRRRVQATLTRMERRGGYLGYDDKPVQEVREVMGHGLQLVLEDGRAIEAADASEGTLRTLAILTALHSTRPATHMLALIDDLDQALHPSAQLELVRVLRKLLEMKPELQIVTTTHSPYLLDAFAEDEVRVLNRDSGGRTVCQPLSAHPEWPKWRGKLQLGEFWSSTGEDWVLEAARSRQSA